MKKDVIKCGILSIALSLNTVAFANSEFNNELTKIDVSEAFDGVVKVNIYTNTPYSEKIIVNKKPDNKYVILLPETSNMLYSKPDLSNVSRLINDVDVKTQPYSSLPGKGYTKITFTAKKPIEIIPQSQVTAKLTPIKSPKTIQVPRRITEQRKIYTHSQDVAIEVPQRIIHQSKPITNESFSSSNYAQQPQKELEPQRRFFQQPLQEQQEIVREEKRSTLSVAEPPTAIEDSILSEEEKLALNKPQAIDEVKQTQSADEITDSDLQFLKKVVTLKKKIVRKVKKMFSFKFSLSSGITILQLILLIVLINIIGNLMKKLQESSQEPQKRERLIHNEETFEPAYPSYSNMDVYNTNRSSFEENTNEGFKKQLPTAPTNYKNKVNSLYSNESFYKPLSEINKEEKMSIFDENDIDIEKTIFKNPLTSISREDELALFDEEEPPKIDYMIESPKGDEFFTFDKQPREISEEEFFIFEDENEEEFESDDEIEEEFEYEEEEQEEDLEAEYSQYFEDEEDAEIEETEEFDDDEANEETPPPIIKPIKEQVPAKNPMEDLKVFSKFTIDEKRGFALVNVSGINALIGFVQSQIFVLRRFDSEISEGLQVRLNEKPNENTSIYIIKLGNYKTLVEVTPEKIRALLDL